MTRHVVRTYTFTCNAPGCEAVICGLTGSGEENSARAARAQATADGWAAGAQDNVHYCPQHAQRLRSM